VRDVWIYQADGTYYMHYDAAGPKSWLAALATSPGQIIKQSDEYRMFFSAATDHPIRRTLGIARTKTLDGPWTLDPEPILPATERKRRCPWASRAT
jgi:beta-xylosidase